MDQDYFPEKVYPVVACAERVFDEDRDRSPAPTGGEARIRSLEACLREQLDDAERGRPEPPGHHCGSPHGACGGECVDFAYWSERRRKALRVLGGASE